MSTPVWVLDTNVIVSGLLNPSGYPGRLLDAVISDHLILALDDRIFGEYTTVLNHPKFQFDSRDIRDFLAFLQQQHWLNAHPIHIEALPDPSDKPFAEVALSLEAPVLVTGNPRHFPRTKLKGLKVLNPEQAWNQLVKRS